jgi:hypothetical protein
VILASVQLRRLGDLDQRAVDVGADEALLAHRLEQIAELALASLHERRADLDLGVRLPAEHRLGDLGRTLPLTGRPQFGQCGVPARAKSRRR